MIQKPMRTSSVRIGGSEQIAGELRRYIEGNMSNSPRDGGTAHQVPGDADHDGGGFRRSTFPNFDPAPRQLFSEKSADRL